MLTTHTDQIQVLTEREAYSTYVDSKGAEGVIISTVKTLPAPPHPTNLPGRSVAQDRRTRLGFS